MGPSARHIPSLDGIRAASFMLVFAFHIGLAGPAVGAFGVTVFFFLSGFLITTLMRRELERNGSVNVRHFYLRRALRILPPLYLVVAAAALAARALYPPGTVSGSDLGAELLFYSNYSGLYHLNRGPPGTAVVWSLAVEEHFYLLFPWLYIAMQKWRMPRPQQAQLLWGLCALILAWRCVLLIGLHSSLARVDGGTDTRVDSILFGSALALTINPSVDPPRGSPTQWRYLLLPAALAALAASVALPPEWRSTVGFSIQGAALTAAFIAAVRFHEWPLFRPLNYRWVAFVGALSYSLYLVHDVWLHATARLWPDTHLWQRALTSLVASLLSALAIYLWVEKPCAQLRRRLTDW